MTIYEQKGCVFFAISLQKLITLFLLNGIHKLTHFYPFFHNIFLSHMHAEVVIHMPASLLYLLIISLILQGYKILINAHDYSLHS